jgi:hypothetical protein
MSSWLRREKDPAVAAQKKLEKEAKAVEGLRSLLQSDAGATAAQQLVQGELVFLPRALYIDTLLLSGHQAHGDTLNPLGVTAGTTSTMAPAGIMCLLAYAPEHHQSVVRKCLPEHLSNIMEVIED